MPVANWAAALVLSGHGSEIDSLLGGVASERHRDAVLSASAVAFATLGDVENANAMLAKSSTARDSSLPGVGEALVKVGKVDDGLVAIRSWLSWYDKAHTDGAVGMRDGDEILAAARGLARAGRVKEALVIVESLEERGLGAIRSEKVRAEIGKALAFSGRHTEALEVFGKGNELFGKEIVSSVADYYLSKQKFSEALEVVQVMWTFDRPDMTKKILAEVAKLDEPSEAAKKFTRSSDVEGLALELADGGNVNEAVAVAEMIRDVTERAPIMLRVAKSLAPRASDEDWTSVSNKALDLFNEPTERIGALLELGEAALAADKKRAAASCAKQAVTIAASMPDSADRLSLVGVANLLSQTGERASAREILRPLTVTAQEIGDSESRALAFYGLALSYAFLGAVDETLVMLHTAIESLGAEKTVREEEFLPAVLVNFAKGGFTAQAVALAKTLHEPEAISQGYKSMIPVLLERGDPTGALHLSAEIPQPEVQAEAMETIALWFADRGQPADAVSVAQRIKNQLAHERTLSSVAVTFAKNGDAGGATALIGQIGSGELRVETIENSGVALAKLGKVEHAVQLAQLLPEATKDSEVAKRRDGALGSIAVELARLGRASEAQSLVMGIVDNDARTRALKDASTELAHAGNVESAISILDLAPDPATRGEWLLRIVRQRIEREDYPGAHTAAVHMPIRDRLGAFSEILSAYWSRQRGLDL